MADYTTELDCVRTFLLKVHTVATTKHSPAEASKLSGITDASYQRMLVHPPELMSVDGDFYWKRYKIEIEEVGEVGLMTAINNIIIGIRKFNKRTAITGFTYASASTMCHIKFANSGEITAVAKSNNWQVVIRLDVQWSTS